MKKSRSFLVAGAIAAVLAAPFAASYFGERRPALPKPELPRAGKECVRPAAEMRERHMILLNRWRDDAVRRGLRGEITVGGAAYRKSLTGACIKCHGEKEKFCDRCHASLAVSPVCWRCHIHGKEGRP